MFLISKTASRLTSWSSRWVPSSLVIAMILTTIVFFAGITIGKASPVECLAAWGDGLWVLLTFAMQMCLIILTGYLIAVSPPVKKLLEKLTNLPRTATGVILSVGLLSMVLCWINWGLGLITGAMLVRVVAVNRSGIDYRLLTASAYLGLGVSWHAGLSGSAPLLMATPGNFLEKLCGTIPVTQTIFSTTNIIFLLIIIPVVLLLMKFMIPEKPVEAEMVSSTPAEDFKPPPEPSNPTPAQKIEHSRAINITFFIAGTSYLIYHFSTEGLVLTLNIVNMVFLSLAFLLHPSPACFVRASSKGSNLLYGIIIQFPLYAGMYGIIKGTEIAHRLSELFISISNQNTFPMFVTWYSGLLNYFVPSGGSKWAIEAPYIIEAAKNLGVPLNNIIMAYSYGDMWTNLIQPFWAIPVLSAAGLEFKDIIGYEMIVAVVYGIFISLFALFIL